MNRKEQEEMELLKAKLALTFTKKVEPDVKIPKDGIINGYSFNVYSKRVEIRKYV